VFSFGDAFMNWREVLLPARFAYRAAGRALAREALIEKIAEGVHKVTLLEHDLCFYWLGTVGNHLHSSIALVFDPRVPHYYLTPPVRLSAESLVLDVGACEGLFSYQVLKSGLARRAVCFEPSARVAAYLHKGAVLNAVADRLAIEVAALSDHSHDAWFEEGECPEASRIVAAAPASGSTRIPAYALDDYCERQKLQLGPRDLIKIDAEGADLDILRGAERLIRKHQPQISVTTYHTENHAREILAWLQSIQPEYRFRIKGFALFGPVKFRGGAKPRPVLLQAAVPCTAER
jgi:FkbM family methyltransferase